MMFALRFVLFVSALCVICYGKAISEQAEPVDSTSGLVKKIEIEAGNSYRGNSRLKRSMGEDVQEDEDKREAIGNYEKIYRAKRDMELGAYRLLSDNVENDDYESNFLNGGRYVPFFRITRYFIEKKKL